MFINAQKSQLSTYLQQHIEDPWQWHVLSEDLFKKAKTENKLIFISSWYAACHWCHVMAKESFSNPELADFFSQHFISVKLDKFLFPHWDAWAIELMQEHLWHAGRPLNFFMNANKEPVFVASYLPAYGDWRNLGLFDIAKALLDLHNKWQLKDYFLKLPEQNFVSPDYKKEISSTREDLLNAYDYQYGWFWVGQKFLPFKELEFLREKKILEHSIIHIIQWGVYDKVDGWVFRYSIDQNRHQPHFEKMLTDQLLFLKLLWWSKNFQNELLIDKTIKDTLQLLEERFLVDGLYCNSIDAGYSHDNIQNYYCFSYDDLSWLSQQELYFLEEYFKFSPQGNVVDEITRLPFGQNHLWTPYNEYSADLLKNILPKLAQIRRNKVFPQIDTSCYCYQNALFGNVLLSLYQSTHDEFYLLKAKNLYKKVTSTFLTNGCLNAVYVVKNPVSDILIKAYAKDYGLLISLCLNLYKYTLEAEYLYQANALMAMYIDHYWNWEYFSFSQNTEFLKVVMNDYGLDSYLVYDLINLFTLYHITGNNKYQDIFDKLECFLRSNLRWLLDSWYYKVMEMQNSYQKIVLCGGDIFPLEFISDYTIVVGYNDETKVFFDERPVESIVCDKDSCLDLDTYLRNVAQR